MQRFNYRVTQDNGSEVRWVANPTVTVYLTGTATIASLFSDDGITALANPFTGPSTGLIFFYAADGKYDIKLTNGTPDLGSTGYTIAAELLDDTLSLGAGATGITTLNTLTAAVQTLVTGSANNDFAISSAGSTHTFNLPTASNTKRGLLSTADWTVFNGKMGSLNTLTNVDQTLAIGAGGSSPNWSSAGGVHTLNLPAASASKTGILSSADWSTFNSKEGGIAAGTTLQYFRGDKTFQTLNTAAVPESGSLYYTDARARLALSGAAPVSYSTATGVISMAVATGGADGYLSSANFTIFNNKMGSLNGLSDASQTFAVGSAGADFAIVSAAGVHTFNLPSASVSNRGVLTTGSQTIGGVKTFSGLLNTKDVDVMAVDTARFVRSSTTTINTSAAENDLTSIILGGAPSANRVYRIHTGGDIQVSTGGADTWRYRVYIGGSLVWDSGLVDATSVGVMPYDLRVDLTVRTAGAAGVIQADGTIIVMDTALATALIAKSTNTTAITLTGTPILKTTITFSVSNATNQINERTAIIQTLN